MVFRRVATQWRVGMAGPVGLDYNVLYRLIDDVAGGDRDKWYLLLDDISVMESAALEMMRAKDG